MTYNIFEFIKDLHAMKHSQTYSAENSIFIFLSFAVAGGFLEAFTYLLHGGVFCNAQTGNLVLFTLTLCTGEFSNASRYLFSILAYLFGILVSAILPTILKRKHPYIAVAGFEIIALAAISFIPKNASDWFTYVSVAFLCALQYNTFTDCRGAKLATTFCTNNMRQAVLNLHGGILEKNKSKLRKSGIYIIVIIAFIVGAALGGFTAQYLGNYSALVCAIALLPAFFRILCDEFKSSPRKSLLNNETASSDPTGNVVSEADPVQNTAGQNEINSTENKN